MTAGGGEYLTEESVLRPYPLYGSNKRRFCPSSDGFTVIAASFAVLTAAITFALVIQIHYGNPEVTPNGAVSTDSELCSQVGVQIMVKGGSAVDVAIASIFCLSVVHPHIVGPGGGGVMLLHSHKTNQSKVIDFMSGVPAKFDIDASYNDKKIGVPGFLAGLAHAHHHYGKLGWAQLVQPAIDIARNGFDVSAKLAKARKALYKHDADLSDPFWKTFYRPVTRMTRENYSEFLKKVSKHGLDSLYLDYGTEIIELLHNKSSIHVKDLQFYKVKEHPVLHMKIKDRSIFTAPPPFGGPQLLAAAQMLSNTAVNSTTKEHDFYHYIIESIRKSYPGYLELDDIVNNDLSNATSEYLAKAVDSIPLPDTMTLADANIPTLPPQASSVVTVLDAFDSYVVVVLGLGSEFGSQVMSKHGILYNNHLANILPHNHASEHSKKDHNPGTRPLTPYTPFIVTDSKQVCGQRALLGSGEVDAALQVLSQIIFRGSDLRQAISRPRVIIRPNQDEIYVHDVGDASRLSGGTRNAMRRMGHTFSHQDRPEASINGVSKVMDTVESWADVRGGGRAFKLKPAGSSSDVSESKGVTWSHEEATTETTDTNHQDVASNVTHSHLSLDNVELGEYSNLPLGSRISADGSSKSGAFNGQSKIVPFISADGASHLSLDNVELGEYSNLPLGTRISADGSSKSGAFNGQSTIVPFISADGASRTGAVITDFSGHEALNTPSILNVIEDYSSNQTLNTPSENDETFGGAPVISQSSIVPLRKGAVISSSNINKETLAPFAGYTSADGSSRSGVDDRSQLLLGAPLAGYTSADGSSRSGVDDRSQLLLSAPLAGYTSADGSSRSGVDDRSRLLLGAPFAGYTSADGSSGSGVDDRGSNIRFGTNTKIDDGKLSAGIVPGDSSVLRE